MQEVIQQYDRLRKAANIMIRINCARNQTVKAALWAEYCNLMDDIVAFNLPEEPIESINPDACNADFFIDTNGNLQFKNAE